MLRLIKRGLLITAMIVYVLACFSPVCQHGEATSEPTEEDVRIVVVGLEALVFGWLMILVGWPTWYANPLILLSIFLQSRGEHGAALTLITAAFLCALSIFLYYSPFVPSHQDSLTAKESHFVRIGTWFWISAILAIWIRSLIIWMQILKLGKNRIQLHPD